MTRGPSLTEQATLDRIEAAADAPESLRARVAEAMHTAVCGECCERGMEAEHLRMADAALAVLRGVA